MDTQKSTVQTVAIYKRSPKKDFMCYITLKDCTDRLIFRSEGVENLPVPGLAYVFRVRENQMVENFWQ